MLRTPRMMVICTLLAPLALVAARGAGPTYAAGERCFSETGYCIGGRFLAFWEQNGGLPVFGYPTTSAREEVNRETGQRYLTQWFERNRFELHPENQPPYDVLLGRLGDDRLNQRGINWQTEAREAGPRPGCLWFEQTGHNVCDQQSGIGFRTFWQQNGLLDPQLDDYGQSLALFGLPLTAMKEEVNPTDGRSYLTQWFERGRFEWHPNNPGRYKVLLGLLGNEVQGRVGAPPAAPGQPEVTWEGLKFSIPAKHMWNTMTPDPAQLNGAQVLAQGRIAFDPNQASNPVELPDGINFTIIRFKGTADQWLALERQAAAGSNAVDPNTIRDTTVAGQRAIAYSYMVTGVSRSENFIVPLGGDRLLLIRNSNADNPDYQAALSSIALTR